MSIESVLEIYKEKRMIEHLMHLPIYREVLKMFVAQQEKGLEKYGELLTDRHSITEFIEHAQQECIDKLLYLEGIKQKLKEE